MQGLYVADAVIKSQYNARQDKRFVYIDVSNTPFKETAFFELAQAKFGNRFALIKPTSWRKKVGPHITLNPALYQFSNEHATIQIDFDNISAIRVRDESPIHHIMLNVKVTDNRLACIPASYYNCTRTLHG